MRKSRTAAPPRQAKQAKSYCSRIDDGSFSGNRFSQGVPMSDVWVFLFGFTFQMLGGRTQLLATRGQVRDHFGLLASLIGIAGGLSFFAMLIWAFATFEWYVALGLIFASITISAILIGRNSFPLFYAARPLVDAIAVAIAAYLWYARWPF